ncbi:MAG: VWA domain-containing protein [Micromonosporaceae bacterium]|nr:VWA domain-containing protein [Micromonosporaceae bacterium]
MIRFLQPWWLLGLLPVVLVAAGYGWRQWRRRVHAVRFSNLELLRQIAPAGLGWRRHAAAAAFLLALVALSTAMARPAVDRQEPVERATIILAIDVSLSMEAEDIAPTRLDAAQQAAVSFVEQLPPEHQLGLVAFARSANVVVPPTTDREAVVDGIENLVLAEATATGEAVFTGLDAIRNRPAAGAAAGPPPARILLLTDGYRTYGRSIEEASAAASEANVPVSTVAFGTDHGVVEIAGQLYRVPVDRESMATLAETTGGQYYEAESLEELTAVYEDMGSSVGHRTVPREITQWYLAGALALALLAGSLSLLWTSRLLP